MPPKKTSCRKPSTLAVAISLEQKPSCRKPSALATARSLNPEDLKEIDDIVSKKIRSIISQSTKKVLEWKHQEWHPRIEEIHRYWRYLTKEEKILNLSSLKNHSDSNSMALFQKGVEFLRRANKLKGYICPVCEYVSPTINQWGGHIRRCFWNPNPVLYELGILQRIEGGEIEGEEGISDDDHDDTMVIDYIDEIQDIDHEIEFRGWDWDSGKEAAALTDFIRLIVVVEKLAAINFTQIRYLRLLREVKKMDSPKSCLVELKKRLEGKTKAGLNGSEWLKLILFTGIIDRAGAGAGNKKMTDKAVLDSIQHHHKKSEIEMSKVAQDIKDFAPSLMQKQAQLASACVYDFTPQMMALFMQNVLYGPRNATKRLFPVLDKDKVDLLPALGGA